MFSSPGRDLDLAALQRSLKQNARKTGSTKRTSGRKSKRKKVVFMFSVYTLSLYKIIIGKRTNSILFTNKVVMIAVKKIKRKASSGKRKRKKK